MLNPVSMVLAGQLDGLLSNTASNNCIMDGLIHDGSMNMDHSSSPDKIADNSDCKCQKDCQQGACGISCTDCGHGFVAINTFKSNTNQNNSELIHNFSSIRHQQPLLVHYRPPKLLNS